MVAGSGNDDDEDLSSPVARRGPSSMSFLQTQSGNMQGVGKQALYRRAVSSAKREDGNAAINTLTETTLLDALAAKVGLLSLDGSTVGHIPGTQNAILCMCIRLTGHIPVIAP